MDRALDRAVRALRAGRLVVVPTDTVLGLAARADAPGAVDRLAAAKERPAHQPLAVILSSTEEIDRWARLSPPARAFVRHALPGPYTILARPSAAARRRFAPAVAGGPSIGLRVPAHPAARALAHRAGPFAATSVNLHGRPPARSVAAARRLFGGTVAVYLTNGPRPRGRPSSLVDVRGARPRVVPRA